VSACLALIRHAEAGKRERWKGDDRLRPLSKKGRRQALALVDALASVPIQRVLSSPYVRCVQSVEPLAHARRLPVEQSEALAEGAGLEAMLALVRELAGASAALCTHGDLMDEATDMLVARGVIRPQQVRYQKGGTWLVEEEGGRLLAARYVPAPVV
jgi:phosphohistidine phosphatase SixA